MAADADALQDELRALERRRTRALVERDLPTLEALHAPTCEPDLEPDAPARQRLAYDELLAHQLALARRRRARQITPGPRITPGEASEHLLAALGFMVSPR